MKEDSIMRTQKTFAELRCRMIRENINQKELAEIAGIADATMTDRMAGRRFFRVNEINRMAARLSIQESDYYRYFFAQENYPSRTPGRACSK